jgi:hypothetical protein
MRKLLLFILLVSSTAFGQNPGVQDAFMLNEPQAVAEGMAYDSIGQQFLFGETFSRRVLIYNKDGKAAGFIDAGADSLGSFLGMTVSPRRELWICGSVIKNAIKVMAVYRYSLQSRKLLMKYVDTAGEAKIFNDVAISAEGRIFITDTYNRSLYEADTATGLATLFIKSDSLVHANGVAASGNILYVSTSRGFARVDTRTKEITITTLPNTIIAGNDGLYAYGNSLVGIQNVLFPFTIGRYHLGTDGRTISKAEVLAANHPAFKMPTTGVIVGNEFYFITNSNIEFFDFEAGKPKSVDGMKRIRVMKVKLE